MYPNCSSLLRLLDTVGCEQRAIFASLSKLGQQTPVLSAWRISAMYTSRS
jgi:hypothetical protein